jgi:NAD(P)-dependent dehydrogenase (short-subunit alcohol dehydrogenase family)
MTAAPWNVRRLPRAEGKNFLVTGGNAGIGYFVAEQLAATGATVVLGSRNAAKAEAAMASIRSRVPGALLRHLQLDLADLGSLKASADALELDTLDAVVLNAGVLSQSERGETKDGHELMFGTNHLGHFAFTAHLLPLLAAAPGSRVVTTGSFAARSVRVDLEDLHSRRSYKPMGSYARSKLAQMLFGFELDRRLRAAGSSTLSVVTHPGGALDSLTPSRPPVFEQSTRDRLLIGVPLGLFVQGKESGAWPAVRAALDPSVLGGQLWGPRVFGLRGRPVLERVRPHLTDPAVAAARWAASVGLTGADPR